jgi:hypothetical protein
MAAMNQSFPPSKRDVAAQRIASFTAEQRRLKAAATSRRAAAVADQKASQGFSVRSDEPSAPARPSQYLR